MRNTQHRGRRLTVIAIVAAFAATGAIAPAAQGAVGATATGAQVMFATTNEYRADAGRAPLARAGLIDNVAQRWAERLRSERRLAHNPNFASQMPSTGRSVAAENVAYGCGFGGAKATAERLMRNLYNSTGHRNNILNTRFTHIGIGFAYDTATDCGYGVQNFGAYAQEFFDVPRSHQFYTEIDWLAAERITTGYASGKFHPKDDVSREAFAAFLYRLAGQPNVSVPSSSPFKDVSTRDPFYKEIVWLAREGITTGYSDRTFRPKAKISREAMAAFLYRFEGQPSVRSASATSFRDINTRSNFLTEISWLSSSGITTGYSDGTFRPQAPVTREATAAFLERAAG